MLSRANDGGGVLFGEQENLKAITLQAMECTSRAGMEGKILTSFTSQVQFWKTS